MTARSRSLGEVDRTKSEEALEVSEVLEMFDVLDTMEEMQEVGVLDTLSDRPDVDRCRGLAVQAFTPSRPARFAARSAMAQGHCRKGG